MNLKVLPNLEKVVAAANEANIIIHDIYFIRDLDTNILEALSISIDGSNEAKSYFTWLLEKSNLNTPSVA